MKQELRTLVYDETLHLEAYRLQGVSRPFPSHFHEYYVMGLVESGRRVLTCRGREQDLKPGHILLLEPGDSHGCAQTGEEELDYRCLNLSQPVMLDLAREVTGREELPGFAQNVVWDPEGARCLRRLHRLALEGGEELEKEEGLLLLLSLLLQKYARPFPAEPPEWDRGLDRACRLMETYYSERVTLDQLCRCAGRSKSALLRAFTRHKGVTPYRYLENIRIREGKRLLEQGASPLEAALATGFSDQSHFSNCFNRFLGLSPGAYREMFAQREEKDHAKE